ncbi:hypothetical protein, partial [Streptomyces anulatus]|uniref:hypothetical protein n=1 Tax=Streptomyces anulatus TaxID=1892 RepID=UPI0036747D59
MYTRPPGTSATSLLRSTEIAEIRPRRQFGSGAVRQPDSPAKAFTYRFPSTSANYHASLKPLFGVRNSIRTGSRSTIPAGANGIVSKPIPTLGKCIGSGQAPARPGSVSAAQLSPSGRTPNGHHSSATAGLLVATAAAASVAATTPDQPRRISDHTFHSPGRTPGIPGQRENDRDGGAPAEHEQARRVAARGARPARNGRKISALPDHSVTE